MPLALESMSETEKPPFSRPYCIYVICSAPRTGSTLLALGLKSTGIAGRPAEYFDIHDRNDTVWRTFLNVRDQAEYFAHVSRTPAPPKAMAEIKPDVNFTPGLSNEGGLPDSS